MKLNISISPDYLYWGRVIPFRQEQTPEKTQCLSLMSAYDQVSSGSATYCQLCISIIVSNFHNFQLHTQLLSTTNIIAEYNLYWIYFPKGEGIKQLWESLRLIFRQVGFGPSFGPRPGPALAGGGTGRSRPFKGPCSLQLPCWVFSLRSALKTNPALPPQKPNGPGCIYHFSKLGVCGCADTQPVRSVEPRDSAAVKSGPGGVTLRGAAAAGRAGGTATAVEVAVFTGETKAQNPKYQLCCWLFVLKTKRKKNIDTTRATHNTSSMLYSNCLLIVLQN